VFSREIMFLLKEYKNWHLLSTAVEHLDEGLICKHFRFAWWLQNDQYCPCRMAIDFVLENINKKYSFKVSSEIECFKF
jgi:hypothetical protein